MEITETFSVTRQYPKLSFRCNCTIKKGEENNSFASKYFNNVKILKLGKPLNNYRNCHKNGTEWFLHCNIYIFGVFTEKPYSKLL